MADAAIEKVSVAAIEWIELIAFRALGSTSVVELQSALNDIHVLARYKPMTDSRAMSSR